MGGMCNDDDDGCNKDYDDDYGCDNKDYDEEFRMGAMYNDDDDGCAVQCHREERARQDLLSHPAITCALIQTNPLFQYFVFQYIVFQY